MIKKLIHPLLLSLALLAVGPPGPLEAAPARQTAPPSSQLSPHNGPLTLVSHGSSRYTIVLPEKPLPTHRAAATELQHYLRLISGVELPISQAPPANGPAIFLGDSAWTRSRGIDPSGYAPDEFSISTRGEDLLLVGRDTDGDPWTDSWRFARTPTLYAVYTLLDRYLGVRWYWPGELGEEVPTRLEVRLPADLELREKPDLEFRYFSFADKAPGRLAWSRRNRIGRNLEVIHGHAWSALLPERLHLKAHPEYFALVNGIRGTRGGSGGTLHQLCSSHPEVRRLVAEGVVRWFDENPTRPTWSISANDGDGHCECDRCRALDVETRPDGTPVLTDRMFDFYNDVARQVARHHPDRKLVAFLYGRYQKVSPRLKAEPNLLLIDVYNFAGTRWWSPLWRSELHMNTALVRALRPDSILLSFFYFDAFRVWNLPQVSSTAITDLIRHLKALGARGLEVPIWGGSHAFAGHDVYLLSRLAWDADQDPEAILEDYYHGLFGPEAGALLRRFHQHIEQASSALGPAMDQRMPLIHQAWALEFFRPLRAEATALLDQAQTLARTDRQRARLALLRANWDYLLLSLDALDAVNAMDAAPGRDHTLDPTLAKLATDKIDARNDFLEQVRKRDPDHIALSVDSIRGADRGACSPFASPRIPYLLEGRQPRAEAHPVTADAPSALDWARIPPLTPFVHLCSAEPVPRQTRARLAYNQRALFVRFEADEPAPELLELEAVTDRDRLLWMQNSLEVFLDPTATTHHFYHLAVNPLEARYDEQLGKGRPGIAWNGEWKVRVTREPERWIAELEIPFATLETPPPAPGSSWRVNFFRKRRDESGEASAWSPPFGGASSIYNVARFGVLTFVP